MVIHKRLWCGQAYTACGAWNIEASGNGARFMSDWRRHRWAWKSVTCKACLKKRGR